VENRPHPRRRRPALPGQRHPAQQPELRPREAALCQPGRAWRIASTPSPAPALTRDAPSCAACARQTPSAPKFRGRHQADITVGPRRSAARRPERRALHRDAHPGRAEAMDRHGRRLPDQENPCQLQRGSGPAGRAGAADGGGMGRWSQPGHHRGVRGRWVRRGRPRLRRPRRGARAQRWAAAVGTGASLARTLGLQRAAGTD